MDVYFQAIGCRLNEAEIQTWVRDFRSAGHQIVNELDQADLVILNTCAVTAEAARKSRKLASRLHRKNPNAKMVITGCFAELEPEVTAELSGVDLVVNNHDKDLLLRVLEHELHIPQIAEPNLPIIADQQIPFLRGGRTRAFVKVQDGCRNRCSFCIVTVARGEERSRGVQTIIDEICDLEQAGYKEAVLTGVHLGGYGSDNQSSLAKMVKEVLANTKIERIRLSSIEPWDFDDELFELWQDPRLGQHLHLPLQSGSDKILRKMARRCTTKQYADLVERAYKAINDITITTDVIVGFPGESEDDWVQTLAFCEKMDFAHMHIFAYSARHGTAAAKMENQIPSAIKRERSRQLHRVSSESRQRCLKRFLGQTRVVLWEGEGKDIGSARKEYSGLTDNYLRSVIEVDQSEDLENELVPVVLHEIENESFRVKIA